MKKFILGMVVLIAAVAFIANVAFAHDDSNIHGTSYQAGGPGGALPNGNADSYFALGSTPGVAHVGIDDDPDTPGRQHDEGATGGVLQMSLYKTSISPLNGDICFHYVSILTLMDEEGLVFWQVTVVVWCPGRLKDPASNINTWQINQYFVENDPGTETDFEGVNQHNDPENVVKNIVQDGPRPGHNQ